jgi:hypothetical protein
MEAPRFDGLEENAEVVGRAVELRAADLQDAMRAAAREGDWDAVQRLLADAKAEAEGNPWVAEVVTSLERLARRRARAHLIKSAKSSSARMRSRLSAKDELLEQWDASAENLEPKAFRRKPEAGKRFDPED